MLLETTMEAFIFKMKQIALSIGEIFIDMIEFMRDSTVSVASKILFGIFALPIWLFVIAPIRLVQGGIEATLAVVTLPLYLLNALSADFYSDKKNNVIMRGLGWLFFQITRPVVAFIEWGTAIITSIINFIMVPINNLLIPFIRETFGLGCYMAMNGTPKLDSALYYHTDIMRELRISSFDTWVKIAQEKFPDDWKQHSQERESVDVFNAPSSSP